MEKKIIVLDRDGVINVEMGRHVTTWTDFRFITGSLNALARLHDAGYDVSIASNQSAVGSGIMSRHELDEITRLMTINIHSRGGSITSIHYCTHTPFDRCDCRKPAGGLLRNAARRHGVETKDLIVVGDSWRDIEAAVSVGAAPVLVRTGNGAETERLKHPVGLPIYHDLLDFVYALTT